MSINDVPILLVTNAGPIRAMNANGRLQMDSRVDGNWTRFPPLFRLRLTGTGTCTVDARNGLDEVSFAVEAYTATDATNQIEFPYPGDDAVEVRITTTDSCRAEII